MLKRLRHTSSTHTMRPIATSEDRPVAQTISNISAACSCTRGGKNNISDLQTIAEKCALSVCVVYECVCLCVVCECVCLCVVYHVCIKVLVIFLVLLFLIIFRGQGDRHNLMREIRKGYNCCIPVKWSLNMDSAQKQTYVRVHFQHA